jgi:hypothetical protein
VIQVCANTGLLPGATTPSYNIRFALPEAEHVQISVFDEHAALVKVLLDSDEPSTLPGQFRQPPIPWDYTNAEGEPVGSGDYRLYFQAGSFVSTSDVEIP